MSDSRLLYDAFSAYYERGMEAFKNGNYESAKRNILAASESLLLLAKESSNPLRAQRMKRAEELAQLVSQIEEKLKDKAIRKASQVDDTASDEQIDTNRVIRDDEKCTLEEAIDLLNQLEGLDTVKQQVASLVDQIKVFQYRSKNGLPTPPMSYHMVFTGNPGTGKTTVARIIGKIYRALGILSSGHLVEVDRGDLVAGFVGQTALKTKDVINKQAIGGVLFIDEAYMLKQSEKDEFGQEAIDTLNKCMEDSRNNLVVIVAGYADKMERFIDSNPGLSSRFRTYINFEDYNGDELYNIFTGLLKKNAYCLTPDADELILKYLSDKKINGFNGNARDVRNLFENMVKLQSHRVASLANPTKKDLMTFTQEDLPFELPADRNCDVDNEPQKKSNKNEVVERMPENDVMDGAGSANINSEYKFDWNSLPIIDFDDIAGLESVKDVVKTKVLLPLEHPDAFDGYLKKNGGGLFLYGPPGTGKTMIAAAIANEIGAKFCSVKPSDLLHQGAGNTERAVRALFAQARQFPCAVIYFDEMDSIAQKNTKSSYSRQLRSEFLSQLQGIEAYGKETGNLLFLIAATNKPWEVDSAFVRPGRFGTKVYVGLPDAPAREYMINSRFNKVREKGIVEIYDDVNEEEMVERTHGFNCSDITNLLDRIDELSAIRGVQTGIKYISKEDVDKAFEEIHSSVQIEDIEKLIAWKEQNNG